MPGWFAIHRETADSGRTEGHSSSRERWRHFPVSSHWRSSTYHHLEEGWWTNASGTVSSSIQSSSFIHNSQTANMSRIFYPCTSVTHYLSRIFMCCIFSAPTINYREGREGEERERGVGRVATWLLGGWTPLAAFSAPPPLTIGRELEGKRLEGRGLEGKEGKERERGGEGLSHGCCGDGRPWLYF